jgi:hypothetical protein
MSKNDDLCVYCYNWEIRKQDIETENNDLIYAWCLDKTSNPYLLRFEREVTTFDIKLPEYHEDGKLIPWKTLYNKIVDYINFRIKKHYNLSVKASCKLLHSRFSYKRMLCKYEGDKKYPVLSLYMKNSACMYAIKQFFKNPIIIKGAITKKMKFECLETDISIVRRLLTRYKLGQCQWFRVSGLRATEKVSYLSREYLIEDSLKPIPYDDTTTWAGNPGVFTFDIETLVDNDFEWSNQDMMAHKIFSISCRYQKYNENNPRIINLILGEAEAPEGKKYNVILEKKIYWKVFMI